MQSVCIFLYFYNKIMIHKIMTNEFYIHGKIKTLFTIKVLLISF